METTETHTRRRSDLAGKESVVTKAYTLYPRHAAVIERVARTEHRSFSNALRVIIERYERTLQEEKR